MEEGGADGALLERPWSECDFFTVDSLDVDGSEVVCSALASIRANERGPPSQRATECTRDNDDEVVGWRWDGPG